MQAPSEKSVEELRAESARTRQQLASTVTALRDRVGHSASELKDMVSPQHIKREIKDYVRKERESMVEAVQRRAKENPLQAVAVGAAIAYPALQLLRAFPTPLLLIGAGLFLTSNRGREVVSDARARLDDAVQEGTDRISGLATEIETQLENKLSSAETSATQAWDAVSDKADSIAAQTRAAFHDAQSSLAGAAGQAVDKAKDAVDSVTASTNKTIAATGERASAFARSSSTGITGFVNDNPLLVAGIGAAVGALLAASIPPSEAENRLFGGSSEQLKGKAREAVAQGIEKTSDIAADVTGAMAAVAAREGLDAAGVQSALRSVADSVRSVADRGIDTALGSSSQSIDASAKHTPMTERNAT